MNCQRSQGPAPGYIAKVSYRSSDVYMTLRNPSPHCCLGLASLKWIRQEGSLETQQPLTLQSWSIDNGTDYKDLTLMSTNNILPSCFQKGVLGDPQRWFPRLYIYPVSTALDLVKRGFGSRSWDRLGPGTWDTLLQCFHLGKRLLEQQNTKKL